MADIYRQLYPWTSLNQFVEQIKGTIAYKSPDSSLIAIIKPFGVGTYTVDDRNHSKQNQDKILYRLSGRPRYCLQDALEPLSQELNSKEPYQVIKSIDRYMSGLVLISNNYEKHRADFLRSLATSRINRQPFYGLRAITHGYPIIRGNKIVERVGVEEIEVDELGDYKEPVIVQNPSTAFKLRKSQSKRVFQVELEVKQINREYSSAYVTLYTSGLRGDFARCYISSKTSFILGDVRFSKRIREILGKPIQVSAFKSSHRYDDTYEPLNRKLRDLLGVSSNSAIPLMLDHHELRLKNFFRKPKEDLLIRSPYMPLHFAETAARLFDLNDADGSSSNDNNDDNNNKV